MNKNEIQTQQHNYLTEIKNTQEMCASLMKTPHFAKMGNEGIFAIVSAAKSLDINPVQALMGGMYYVKGRVEMQSRMMAALIRSKKHSITRDSKSSDQICILHGRRADTKDCWSESFSIEEAKKAGIYRGPWLTYPKDMLYARALSRLARQLFPDIIGNCYVEGEIGGDSNIQETTYQSDSQPDIFPDKRTEEEVQELIGLFNQIPPYRKEIEEFLNKKEIFDFEDMPKEMYEKVVKRAKVKIKAIVNQEVSNV